MSNLRLRFGTLERLVAERPGAAEWKVAVDGEGTGRAISYVGLTEALEPGDGVLLNTAAAALGLGSGGLHLIVSRLGRRFPVDSFAGPEAGHVMKLRYTPLQHRVLSVEEEASPHREAILSFESLGGAPVLVAELHSQMAAAAIAAHAARPELRLVYVMTDSAALPAPLSRLAHALREQGVLVSTVSAGQAFGGDYEAVNLHTALIAARAVAQADLILVAQGPGNVGTGSEYGFSGLSLLEALHAADALGGQPLLVPRISFAESRERHRGLSHHTVTLARLVRCPVEIPLLRLPEEESRALQDRLAPAGAGRLKTSVVDAEAVWPALETFRPALTSMGRSVAEDRIFFAAAAAAGLRAAELAERNGVSHGQPG